MSLLTYLTYALPHRALSGVARRLAYSTDPRVKTKLIHAVVQKFGVNLDEAANPDPDSYPTFNAFFTRALRDGARSPAADPNVLTQPADGRISQCGPIAGDTIFQAKGKSFTATQLLGDAQLAASFHDGVFATVYLSPKDYHRVHMPWTGTLTETLHVPGRLFSVGPDAVSTVDGLFARNERLVCMFDTDFGPMALVMVGALLVSGVETVWSGVEIPEYGDRIRRKDYRDRNITLERFAEMARFNYGSTVIVLLPKAAAQLDPSLLAETPVRLGEPLARRL